MRLVMASFNFIGGAITFCSTPSMRKRTRYLLFVRLDVNIAGPALDRVGENQVHQLDDRRFFGGLLERGQVHLGFVGGQFQVGFVAGQVLHYFVEFLGVFVGAVELGNGLADRGFGSHHRLDVESGHELDVVHGEDLVGSVIAMVSVDPTRDNGTIW